MVPKKKPTVKVVGFPPFKWGKWQLSPLNMCENQIWSYIHYLFDEINSHTKFPRNQLRTWNVHLKLFDKAVTLEYNPGHWKWYEWNANIYHVHRVQENLKAKVFATYVHSASQPACQPASLTLFVTQTHVFMWVKHVQYALCHSGVHFFLLVRWLSVLKMWKLREKKLTPWM